MYANFNTAEEKYEKKIQISKFNFKFWWVYKIWYTIKLNCLNEFKNFVRLFAS